MPKSVQDMLCCYGTEGEASLALSVMKNTFLSRALLEGWDPVSGKLQSVFFFSLFSSLSWGIYLGTNSTSETNKKLCPSANSTIG